MVFKYNIYWRTNDGPRTGRYSVGFSPQNGATTWLSSPYRPVLRPPHPSRYRDLNQAVDRRHCVFRSVNATLEFLAPSGISSAMDLPFQYHLNLFTGHPTLRLPFRQRHSRIFTPIRHHFCYGFAFPISLESDESSIYTDDYFCP